MRGHKHTLLEDEAVASHSGGKHHHEVTLVKGKTMYKTVNQLEAPFKQVNSLARCSSRGNRG